MIAMDTLMNGVDRAGSRNITGFETGQLEIFAKGYYREEGVLPLDTVVTHPEQVTALMESIPGVKGVTSRLKFPARLNNGVDELPVVAIGIDLVRESEVFATKQAIVKGDFIPDESGCLIGAELAQDMKSDVGSLLTLICRDKNGTYNAYDFTVVGLLSTTHPLIDRNAVLIELSTVQELMAMPGQVTEVCLKTSDDQAKIVALKKTIQAKLGKEYEVYDWTELNAALFRILGIKKTVGILIAVVVLVIAAVGIINTMLMAVMERIPEIGMILVLWKGRGCCCKIRC
jgi:putative ABC transport system permease protein